MKCFRTGLVLALFAALGCSETATGPSAADFNEKRSALKAKTAEKGGKKGRAKAKAQAAQPDKKGKAGAGGVLGAVERDYVYDPTGKRDPFRNFKWDRPDRLRDREVTGPLEQFDLNQLEVVAVVWKTGNARALVQDPSGATYIVAEGARIGKNEGYVIDIADNQVRVKETYVDFLGRETTKDIDMPMRGSEGG